MQKFGLDYLFTLFFTITSAVCFLSPTKSPLKLLTTTIRPFRYLPVRHFILIFALPPLAFYRYLRHPNATSSPHLFFIVIISIDVFHLIILSSSSESSSLFLITVAVLVFDPVFFHSPSLISSSSISSSSPLPRYTGTNPWPIGTQPEKVLYRTIGLSCTV